MRFLLINPYYPISETPSPPLGLAYLAASLEHADVEVRLLDLVVFPYRRSMLESLLNEFSPNFVGVTAVTMTYDNAVGVVKDVKHINPDIMTVMGGPHVTFCPEETLRLNPEIDFVVLGEGEETVVDLVRESQAEQNWRKVKGIVFKEGSEMHNTGPRKFIDDVDALPMPARHLIPLGRYRSLGMPISLTTSRGCPFNCTFCVGRKMSGRKVRYRDPSKVADEFEHLSNLKFHQINIADDLFTANDAHCISICEEIIRRKLDIQWSAFSRVDTIKKNVLQIMKDAGCGTVSFGVESGNKGILKSVRKGITLEQATSAVQMCVDAGITPHASFILGLPGETPETLADTVEFGKRLKNMGASYGFHLLAPFPGTEIRENAENYDIKILTEDWREYHANSAIVETSSVKKEMLDEIALGWERKYIEYLGNIKIRMSRGEAEDNEVNLLTGLESTVLIYELMMANVIEEKGCWINNGKHISDKQHLKTLVEKIGSHSNYTKDQIYHILSNSLNKGSLLCNKRKGTIEWLWSNHI